MDPQTIATLLQLGVAGAFLYAFLADKIRTKAQVDDAEARADAHIAEVRKLYDAALVERDQRIREERRRGDEWKGLALGTERRLDQVTPVLATAITPAVPSAEPAS